MWTINDFPAYANLSGWSTKGQYVCPCCGIETTSRWLRHGKKICYMCHRRWLAPNHKWRLNSRDFDGTRELRNPPRRIDGSDILRQMDESREEGLANGAQPWKKKSIFFTLPYWQYNVLRHNLDVMHIEKNVCDNIIGTLLNQEGKSKDNYKARVDLVDMGIRNMLHPQPSPKSSIMFLPRACYQMTNKEKDAFLSILKNVKTPDECSSSIPRCVHIKQHKIFGLKSYDCHVLMQELIPIALRGTLPDKVTSVLIDFCNFFKKICSKVLNVEFLEHLESQIAVTLCQLETMFPPSFFTIMVHLVIHLAYEAKVAGPVQYRWMYPIERFNRPRRNDDEIDSTLSDNVTFLHPIGRPLGGKRPQKLQIGKRKRIQRLDEQISPQVTHELRWLARGPSEVVRRYTGYAINGFRFHTKKRERHLKTQNSGVVVKTKTSKDEIDYFGQLTDIIQLDYSGKYKVVLFKCNWVDIKRGVKKDKFGLTLVNFKFLKHTGKNICDDPFVFASQAKKGFYVYDERNKDWHVVLNAKVRDIYDMGDEESNKVEEIHEQIMHDTSEDTRNVIDLVRVEVEDDNDFFEVVVDVDNLGDNENEEEEEWENMF
ncbi:uncharacterized protein [Cicer arietinum]|uniref:Uncharacterized protein LOC101490381 n=1 Tax=Cicer arietinum TaxID=3827 RepID=A0A1S2Z6T8_CICAR|nr:uncharacterized protein LOC101490381 [Cicer arietinum]